ncbi:hypothetical protein [Breznakibacter xylanolyticus]|nr:hypothetical protein [Breznakibacter xylanolyticus]MBN2744620.1 hypothetical protein [Marinilabiliaceae bacterium]
MKRVIISLMILLSLGSLTANAQCGEDVLKKALNEMGNGQYIKDFNIDIKSDTKEVKFSIILNSRSQYNFNIVNGSGNGENIVMELLDAGNVLFSTADGGKYITSAGIIIGKTKVYTLKFYTKGGGAGCARAVQSLVKQFTAEEMGN